MQQAGIADLHANLSTSNKPYRPNSTQQREEEELHQYPTNSSGSGRM